MEESKTNEETAKNIEHDFRNQVIRISPMGLRVALQELASLVKPRRHEFGMNYSLNCWAIAAFGMDGIKFPLHFFGFLGGAPNLMPILFAGRGCSSPNDVKHILSTSTQVRFEIHNIKYNPNVRILFRLTFAGTIALQVVDEC